MTIFLSLLLSLLKFESHFIKTGILMSFLLWFFLSYTMLGPLNSHGRVCPHLARMCLFSHKMIEPKRQGLEQNPFQIFCFEHFFENIIIYPQGENWDKILVPIFCKTINNSNFKMYRYLQLMVLWNIVEK